MREVYYDNDDNAVVQISENTAIYDSVIVDLTPVNFTYLYC